jgi:CheY-like chemotaxis protein
MSSSVSAGDVIVADNDYIIRDILRSLLATQGFTVLPAVNGLEAVSLARRTLARLVILDYRMPQLDGCAACSEIRRLPGYAIVPIAILTAFDDPAVRGTARRTGATTLFAKPFKPVDLLREIGHLLGGAVTGANALREAMPLVWRRHEPTPVFGESAPFSEGRRVLNICRR